MATDTRLPIATGSSSAPSSWGLGDGQAIPWEYAPAPEARDIVTLKERYGLFIGGREVAVERRRDVRDRSTPPPSSRSPRVARATAADVDKAVRAARRAQTRSWGTLSGEERAKYLFRIARILQERSREFAVLESMDSGKPIKESRDVDVPLAAAHFWYYAGWADKLEYAFPGRVGAAARRRRPDHPVELPAADAGLEDRPGARRRQHGRPQAGLDDAALRAALRRGLPAGRPAAGRRQHRPGPGEIGMSLVTHPGVDKVAFTGSTEIGSKIYRGVAGTDKALTLELGGKAANIVFDDAPLDQAVEGIVNGIYFNQGEVCCAGSRLLVQESIAETAHRQAQGPPVDDPRRRPARQEHRRRGDQLEEPAREDHRARRVRASPRAPSSTSRPATCPSAATSSGRRCSRTSPRATASRARRSSGRCCRC